MNETILDQFVQQSYIKDLFHQVVANVTDLSVQSEVFNQDMIEQGVKESALYTEKDLAFLDRKVGYLNSDESLVEYQSLLKHKLTHFTNEQLMKHIEFMEYLTSDLYKEICKAEEESYIDFANQVNTIQKLVKVEL